MPSLPKLTCLCGLVNESAAILSSLDFPLDSNICHCHKCRHQTGSLGTWYAFLKGSPSEQSLRNTQRYASTERYTMFFCRQCGCNVFVRSKGDGRWLACAGVIEPGDDPATGIKVPTVAKIQFHEYVGDTHYGGLAACLTNLGGREIPCYVTEPGLDDAPLSWDKMHQLKATATATASLSPAASRDNLMKVACHCGGVELQIKPPVFTDTEHAWYVPGDRNRYLAKMCSCRSCRLALGFSLQPWAYVPPYHILTRNGEPVVFGPGAKHAAQIEALQHYESSADVLRSFCGVCGATIFYQCYERPEIIDVSVGVIESQDGNALAGEWLMWNHKRVSYKEETVDDELVAAWMDHE